MSEQNRYWAQWAAPERQSQILGAEKTLAEGDVANAKRVLEPLAELGEPAALTMMSQLSHETEPLAAFEVRQRLYIEKAAEQNFPPALYLLGSFLDVGDCGYVADRFRAAQFFRRAAEFGHTQSQWIYALDLLNGTNGIARNTELGRAFLLRAFEAGLQRALETVADFHRRGAFGFEKNESLADEVLSRAQTAENWV